MRGAHVCMSGNMECSGVDPCDPCASATMTYVLVPAMKAAGIDQRNDPRVASFLRTYAEARKHLVNGIHAQAAQQPPPPPPPMTPQPSRPPVADLPLTEAELEAMAHPAPHATIAAPSATMVDAPMAGGPDVDYAAQDAQQAAPVARPAAPPPPPGPLPPPPEPPIPAGLMTDEEFAAKFPKAVPEELMVMPPKPEPVPEPEPAEPVSLFKLAADAITPKPKELPAEEPTSDTSEVGSAPTQPAPLSAPAPQAPKEDVSAVAPGANNQAETTATKVEASTHG